MWDTGQLANVAKQCLRKQIQLFPTKTRTILKKTRRATRSKTNLNRVQNQISERSTNHDEETRIDVGEPEDEFEGEDGEEPWGVDAYAAEGYAPP